MSTIEPFDWRDESDDHLLFGDSDKDFFFEEGSRAEYVQQLQSLSRLDEQFVFVLGDAGMGKTSILHEFIRRQSDATDCVYIEVPILADAITLLENITTQCDISVSKDSDASDYITAIRDFIQTNADNDRPFILAIDDADGLPDDALKSLLKLIGKTSAPHFIFASHDVNLQNRIASLVPFYRTHTIEVRPLTEAEAAGYTDLYLSSFDIENNFSDNDVYDIFLSSSGNIGEINKVISASVDNRMQLDNADYLARTQKISTLQVPRFHLIAVIIAIIGLGALGLYFMNHTTTANKSATTVVTTPTVEPIAANDDALTTETKTKAVVVTASAEKTLASVPTTAASAQQGKIATAAPTSIPTQKPSAAPATSSGNWLSKAPSTHFTLQMMGSFSKDSVANLINGQSNQKQWAVYQTTRDGKPWFVAVYGNYASKKAAQEAAEKLPAGLREGKPWPKAISVIHKEMKQ